MSGPLKKSDHTSVEVKHLPTCDFDPVHGKAHYDGKTHMGPWANMCEDCFKAYGSGLGLGKGQRLVVRPVD
jgi:hypothetical protein